MGRYAPLSEVTMKLELVSDDFAYLTEILQSIDSSKLKIARILQDDEFINLNQITQRPPIMAMYACQVESDDTQPMPTTVSSGVPLDSIAPTIQYTRVKDKEDGEKSD